MHCELTVLLSVQLLNGWHSIFNAVQRRPKAVRALRVLHGA
jgi:hypothetical protein